MTPRTIDGVFPAELYRELCAMVNAAPLCWGAKSHHANDPIGHASWKPLHDDSENLSDLSRLAGFEPFEKFWRVVGKQMPDTVPVRVYANVAGYGMDGYFHRDSERAGELTCIVYCCDDWMYDWAGETVVLSADQRTYWSIVPRTNRALIIPSNLQHCARGVARCCPRPRITFMFKTRPRRDPMFEAVSGWLVEKGAMGLKHQTGTLHDHLMRVYQLLRDKGGDMDVSVAGAMHSIYGTTVFRQKLLEPTESNRAMIRSEWGPKVEDLVYMFSMLEARGPRMETSFSDWKAPQRSLCMIEAANLMDQGGLDKLPQLKEFWEGLSWASRGDAM